MKDFVKNYELRRKIRPTKANSSRKNGKNRAIDIEKIITPALLKINRLKPIKIGIISISVLMILFLATKLVSHNDKTIVNRTSSEKNIQQKKTPDKIKVDHAQKTIIDNNKTISENKKNAAPKYTFYSNLTKDNVNITEKDTNQEIIPSYIVQVASYNNQNDANAMRAKLILLGFKPQINQFGKWYRVDLGPVKGSRAGDQIKHKLQESNITGSILQKV